MNLMEPISDLGARQTKLGRPRKYVAFLSRLEDHCLYSPALIVRKGIEAGLLDSLTLDAAALARQKMNIRHTMARIAKSNNFPDEGDGYISLPGQARVRAWTGQRWKAVVIR